MTRAIARALGVPSARFFEFEDEAEATTSVIEKFQRILDSRTPEEQSQALRIIRALFGL
jgi:hypothetical protein